MTCQSPKMLFIRNRLRIIEPGTFLPGQDAPVHPDYAGFKGSGLRDGYYLPVDCGRCKSCIFKAVMAKTGAMLCEAQHSGDVAFLTLTYAPDAGSRDRSDMADKLLLPGHIRRFREDLRRDPHYGKFRSVIVGEHGDLRGRAHWHCILYSSPGQRLPELDYGVRFDFKHWPHGHVFAEGNPGQQAFSYVVGYTIKALREGAGLGGQRISEYHFTASRRPVIGHRTFVQLAERAADFRVPPSFGYLPPGGNRRYRYTMRDRSRDLYIDAYLDRLALVAPDDPTFSALRGPLMRDLKGAAFASGDEWIDKAVIDGLCRREARLNPVPPAVSAEADRAEMVADLRDKQSRQARINRLQDEKRLAADLRRSDERRKRLDAERRVAGEVQRLKAWAERLNPPRLHDPADPFEEGASVWDDLSVGPDTFGLVRSGAWRLD